LGNTLLIFKNTNLVGVWISLEVSVIFKRDKFSGYVGDIKGFGTAKKPMQHSRYSHEHAL